ncbi:MAG: hypothetical protein A2770_03000 [Candidatus Levybacteria bacterium RIFCSPHIGHO2_01_FULL_38_12]|nr:MAG: hypothetical protein A2770_03000 [Candidatus Levybacteria bacterium RIFCSPHIGHO2_01_FULL_38_12]
MKSKVHKTAEVHVDAHIGNNTVIWNYAQIESCKIGAGCTIGKGVYVGPNVEIGDNCKIQNNCSIYEGVSLESGVFVGPHVVFTNDKTPRAINFDGTKKTSTDWKLEKTLVCEGASLGAGVIVLGGVRIGKFALIGAGTVVTKNVLDHALILGVPGTPRGYVCKCGLSLKNGSSCSVCFVSLGKNGRIALQND